MIHRPNAVKEFMKALDSVKTLKWEIGFDGDTGECEMMIKLNTKNRKAASKRAEALAGLINENYKKRVTNECRTSKRKAR